MKQKENIRENRELTKKICGGCSVCKSETVLKKYDLPDKI